MPNKIKIVIASLLILVLGLVSFLVIQSNKNRDKDIKTVTQTSISSSSYYSYNQNSSNQSLSSNLVSSSAVSLTSLSSSSSKAISSESQVVSSVQKSSKSTETASSKISNGDNSNKNKCNPIKAGETKYTDNYSFYYEPDNRCVKIGYIPNVYEYGSVFKGLSDIQTKEYNDNKLFLSDFNINLVHSIANDYISKVKPKIYTKDFKVYMNANKSKNDQNKFSIEIYSLDPEYIKINVKAETIVWDKTIPRFRYQYFIYQDSNNNWSWKFNKELYPDINQ
jgi:hypothetical protein